MPASVTPQDLEASARRELRALGRSNAENVARHLVMVQRLLDSDPELAYQHARYAASHAGRIAVVRETAGIAAYLSEHYHEALRDIRAARRLSGLDLHRAIEADSERALGHLDRALKAAQEADPRQFDDAEEAEIAMVVSGVRHEMGQTELGLVVVEEAIMMFRGDRETLRRLHSVRADRLEELGRTDEASKIRERIGEGPQDQEDESVEVYDIEEDFEAEAASDADADAVADAVAEAGSDAEADAVAEAESDAEADAVAEAESDGEADAVADAESDGDSLVGPGADVVPEAPASSLAAQAETGLDADALVAEVVEDDLTSDPGEDVEALDDLDTTGDLDNDWSGPFSQRVEAEMAELLGEDDPESPLEAGSDDAEPDAALDEGDEELPVDAVDAAPEAALDEGDVEPSVDPDDAEPDAVLDEDTDVEEV